MVRLQLIDVETGSVIGTHHIGQLPELGDTIMTIRDQRVVPLEIVELETVKANENDMFSRDEHWAKCRFKPA